MPLREASARLQALRLSPARRDAPPGDEDELIFEDGFGLGDGGGSAAAAGPASADSTPRSTPRHDSLVGPSALPDVLSPPSRGAAARAELAAAAADLLGGAAAAGDDSGDNARWAAAAASSGGAEGASPVSDPAAPGAAGWSGSPQSPLPAAGLAAALAARAAAAAAPPSAAAAAAAPSPPSALKPGAAPLPPVTTHVPTAAGAAAAAAAAAAGAPPHKTGPADFELLRVVGQGAFGKVFQVRKRDTGEVFAMKVMRKDRVLGKGHGGYVRAERDALTAVVHPYVVTLRYSFQTSRKLYLVLDFVNGGHLFFQLYRAGTFDEPLTRLYAAELVLAVSHLHALGFVHRDLKPENVLLDAEGHVRVTDFGLARAGASDAAAARTNSYIGTVEYMAPEVVAGTGHGKAVDWWSVGVLVHEMLCGVPPFRAKSRAALQKAICGQKLKLPSYLSAEAASLLKGLLQKEPAKRLGFGPDGAAALRAHPFFRRLDWAALEARALPSPFRPTIASRESTENFDKIWTDLPARDSPCPSPSAAPGGGRAEGAAAFDGFSYVAPSACLAAAGAAAGAAGARAGGGGAGSLGAVAE